MYNASWLTYYELMLTLSRAVQFASVVVGAQDFSEGQAVDYEMRW